MRVTIAKRYTLINNLQQAEKMSSDFIFSLLYLGCFVFEFQGTSFINDDYRKYHFPVLSSTVFVFKRFVFRQIPDPLIEEIIHWHKAVYS